MPHPPPPLRTRAGTPARRWLRRLGLAAFTLLGLGSAAALLLAFGAWLLVRPMAGEWNAELALGARDGAPRVSIGVARALQVATDPRFARWLDGRTLQTGAGPVVLHWRADTATLVARCAPCRLRHAALGRQALELPSLEVTMHRDAARADDGAWNFSGHAASRAVVLPWRGTLTKTALVLRGELAPTPVAALLALFGEAIPETRRARIDGTLAARWQFDAPAGRLSVAPRLDGFAVAGLGTEALRDVRLPERCAAPRGAPAQRSRWLERAVIAAEDSRFAEHPGYDLAEAVRWLDTNQRAGGVRGGGSTLTQQLAKQLHTGDERSVPRKLRELLYAVEMEQTLGKGRILQLYLAIAPWGPQVCGAAAAARHHLGKPLGRVDPIEAAWLASLLPRPAAVPPPVDRERIATILEGLTGTTLAQRRRWLRELEGWQPPRGAPAPAPG